MPQLIVKGIREDEVKVLAKSAAPDLADICNCPIDWFTFDYIPSKFYDFTGKEIVNPVIQVWWFERPQELQDKVAKCLDKHIKSFGYTFSQISFSIFYDESIYKDGEHS